MGTRRSGGMGCNQLNYDDDDDNDDDDDDDEDNDDNNDDDAKFSQV